MNCQSDQQGPGHPLSEINTDNFNVLVNRPVPDTGRSGRFFLPGGKICRRCRGKAGSAAIASRGYGLY